jgi:CRP/FNR family transcriptional regulator
MDSKVINDEKIKESIGYLFEEELIDEIVKIARVKELATDETIIQIGDRIPFLPIILSGAIKVVRENEKGEDLLLYYIEVGDTCAMTMQCCVKSTLSEVKASTIEPSEILMIPLERMEQWMAKYASWRSYILQSYHYRIQELIETIDAIAFMRLDERLLKYLKDQAKLIGNLEIPVTHQQIADDLNSSRVVISRLLKQLETKGDIKLTRNKIILNQI